MPTPHFVILHHRVPDGEHWDFMLETGAVLSTWRLAAEPTGPARWPISAERIGEHRKAYLQYEGPIGDDRGFVTRVDGGVYRLVHRDENRWEFELDKGRLTGRYALARLPDRDEWQLIPLNP